jgi:hypothetical protein
METNNHNNVHFITLHRSSYTALLFPVSWLNLISSKPFGYWSQRSDRWLSSAQITFKVNIKLLSQYQPRRHKYGDDAELGEVTTDTNISALLKVYARRTLNLHSSALNQLICRNQKTCFLIYNTYTCLTGEQIYYVSQKIWTASAIARKSESNDAFQHCHCSTQFYGECK